MSGRELVNCLNPEWIIGDMCIPPKGKICRKKSLGQLNGSDSVGQRAVDALVVSNGAGDRRDSSRRKRWGW